MYRNREDMEMEEEVVSENEQYENVEAEADVERKLVIPGEVIVSGDYLPGDFTRKEGNDVISNRYGLAEINGRVVRIIPISGVYEPRRGNSVIGRVEDVTFSGWIIDVGGPYSSFLSLSECPRFINKSNIEDFAIVGDIMSAKINNVKKGGIDLTIRIRGLGKLDGGRVIRINPHKVPRVIGRGGSMINMIKMKTDTEINVGQNGFIWLKGSSEGERKSEEAINMIVENSATEGLTDRIEKFLGGNQ